MTEQLPLFSLAYFGQQAFIRCVYSLPSHSLDCASSPNTRRHHSGRALPSWQWPFPFLPSLPQRTGNVHIFYMCPWFPGDPECSLCERRRHAFVLSLGLNCCFFFNSFHILKYQFTLSFYKKSEGLKDLIILQCVFIEPIFTLCPFGNTGWKKIVKWKIIYGIIQCEIIKKKIADTQCLLCKMLVWIALYEAFYPQDNQGNAITIPILQSMKLRHSEVKELAKSHS